MCKHASGKVGWFCTRGHRRQFRAASGFRLRIGRLWSRTDCMPVLWRSRAAARQANKPETSRAHCWACQYEEAATSRSIGRLADAARSLPFSAFRRPHQLVNRAQQTGLSAENQVLFRAANYPVWSETQHRDRRQEKCCLEEQFTAEDLFLAIKNRLPGQVAQVHAFGALKSASGSSKRILHIHYIGRTSGKLQRCLETKPN